MKDILTTDILKQTLFERVETDWERNFFKVSEGINDYAIWQYTTDKQDGKDYIVITIKENLDNKDNDKWYMHIDNCDRDTICRISISTIEQFNNVMELYKSNFRI